ncbi:MAG: T9SS type A sorting domain-containing protein [Bacteroidetes bacterium]|nr:T9SS type A sorting domain-containing protein [Bacteroidota bacterium]
MKIRGLLLLFFACLAAHQSLRAQDKPIGYWRSHLPYNNALSVATDNVTVYAATDLSFFTYNTASEELSSYSKAEGMSDIDMKYVAYDATTATAVLAYKNCNLDLFKNNTFYNVPDLKLKSVAGNKSVNSIFCENGYAYVSTTIGIVVLNLGKREIKETYEFSKNNQTINIYGLCSVGNYFYAATDEGLFKANKNAPNLQAFSAWAQLDTSKLTNIVSYQGKVITSSDSLVYAVENDTLRQVYNARAGNRINHLDLANGGVYLSIFKGATFNGICVKMNDQYQVVDSFHTAGEPRQTADMAGGPTWVADIYNGLRRRVSGDVLDFDPPNGPGGPLSSDIYAYNKDVVVTHGGINDLFVPSGNGMRQGYSEFKDDKWTNYTGYNTPALHNLASAVSICKDNNTGTLYIGSATEGLFIINTDGSVQQLKEGSPLEHSGPNSDWWQATGETLDSKGDLWVTMLGSTHELNVKTPEGNWYNYIVPVSRPYPSAAARIITDDNDQLWYICPGGSGVMVYNFGGTPESQADDQFRNLGVGAGYGNLPSATTYSIVKDKSGSIWIGTADGIGIVNCPGDVIAHNCEAERRIVQYDQFAGYLFQGESVKALAVDGADRKWVGTANGVWLLSPDASKIIYRFTADNSPLPSNNISKIAIDPVTGDVYIGTDKGLVSYRSTAVDGGEKNENVLVFPNPVPASYTGTIAVKGVADNSDVRITDISGQLIYRSTALGGQAVWNGLDYTGRKPQSGVYLIFIANKDGSQKHVGKVVFLN